MTSPPIEVPIFLVSLLVMLAGCMLLSSRLDALGTRFDLRPGVLGLIVAFGANSPEICSAVTALFSGNHDVGIGVVVGSNLFNLAALLGLGAALGGRLPLKRSVVVFNGLVSLLATSVGMLMIGGLWPPAVSMTVLSCLFLLYALLICTPAAGFRRLPGTRVFRARLVSLVDDVHEHARQPSSQSRRPWLAVPIGIALSLIVVSSIGLVHTALALGSDWHVPPSLIGTLILAALTGLPNAYTAVSLARQGDGAAVVSETLNSNTINIVVGLTLPALIFGISTSAGGVFELGWLLVLTALTIGLIVVARGLTRWIGAVVICIYVIFVGLQTCGFI
ncbi:sodium:calcium antiporter [Salinisphaera orenii]|uniref:sodium:calcium antiporter n=1 Tax=Salinisphaera orenii TaxID=856731 RepID=UPI000DBE9D3C